MGIGALAGALIGLLAEIIFDKAFFNVLRHPNLWPTSQHYLASHLFPALLFGAVNGMLLVFLAPLKTRAQVGLKWAVGREYLMAGALAGGGGMFVGIWLAFLALIDNPRTPATCIGIIVASLLAGVIGAVALTALVYAASGSQKKPGISWALAGGFLAGLIGFMLSVSVAYSF